MPVTYSDVGVMVRGGVPTGYLSRITYDAWVVNGLSGDPGDDLRDMRDHNIDVNGSKFLGGRIGLAGPIGMDLGASLHTGIYNEDDELRVTLIGIDARFEHRGFELKGEFVQATRRRPPTISRSAGSTCRPPICRWRGSSRRSASLKWNSPAHPTGTCAS
jgi:hypothetical protein